MKMKHSGKALRLFLVSAAMTCVMAVNASAADTGIIIGEVVNVRTGPGTGYDRVEMLAAGKKVTILGEENGWYHISWNDSKGYVLSDYVAPSSSNSGSAASTQNANATVTGGGTINVRTGPGTGYSRVAMVGSGKRVEILGSDSGWYKISFDGKTGYILADFLIPDGAASASAAAAQTSAGASANATVTGGGTINVRTGPGTGYSRVTLVGTGKRVEILGSESGWYKVSFDGKTGYIFAGFLIPDDASLTAAAPAEASADMTVTEEPTPLAESAAQAVAAGPEGVTYDEPRNGVITGGTINVRIGPGTNYDRIARVSTGKKVSILGEENGWYRVKFDDTVGYVLGDYLFEGDSLPASSIGEQVAALAQQYYGTRYVYGGASPSGFDCSGFTMYLYKQFGYSLPHSASSQYANCGYKVSKSELQPGDLVFFTSSGNGGRINHVGVYIGNGQVIHARLSIGQVYINSLSESYYAKNYVGAVRIA